MRHSIKQPNHHRNVGKRLLFSSTWMKFSSFAMLSNKGAVDIHLWRWIVMQVMFKLSPDSTLNTFLVRVEYSGSLRNDRHCSGWRANPIRRDFKEGPKIGSKGTNSLPLKFWLTLPKNWYNGWFGGELSEGVMSSSLASKELNSSVVEQQWWVSRTNITRACCNMSAYMHLICSISFSRLRKILEFELDW